MSVAAVYILARDELGVGISQQRGLTCLMHSHILRTSTSTMDINHTTDNKTTTSRRRYPSQSIHADLKNSHNQLHSSQPLASSYPSSPSTSSKFKPTNLEDPRVNSPSPNGLPSHPESSPPIRFTTHEHNFPALFPGGPDSCHLCMCHGYRMHGKPNSSQGKEKGLLSSPMDGDQSMSWIHGKIDRYIPAQQTS